MISKAGIAISILLHCAISSSGQKGLTALQFVPSYGDQELDLDQGIYSVHDTDSMHFETLRFYISGIELLNNNKPVWKEKQSYHLVDASMEHTLKIALNVPAAVICDQVRFQIGIDSATHMAGAMGNDLDPTKGMYWTWQSGYINFKLEGKSNLCAGPHGEFQFHIGGYKSPFNSLRPVLLPFRASAINKIRIDIRQLITEINLETQDHIMSPGEAAMQFASLLPGIYKLLQP
jgi:hypothetical protein